MNEQNKPDLLIETSGLSVRSRRITLYSLTMMCIIGVILIAVLLPEGSYKFVSIMLLFFGIIYLVNLITATFGNSGKTTGKIAEETKPHRKSKIIAKRKK